LRAPRYPKVCGDAHRPGAGPLPQHRRRSGLDSTALLLLVLVTQRVWGGEPWGKLQRSKYAAEIEALRAAQTDLTT
jgi:hypothetical protein